MPESYCSALPPVLQTLQTSGHSLVKQLKAGLAYAHFLLNAKLRNGGVLRRTLATEDLSAGSTMVLEEQRTQIEVGFLT